MSYTTTKEWVYNQPWYKPETKHYGEECRKNHCKCIRQEEELTPSLK